MKFNQKNLLALAVVVLFSGCQAEERTAPKNPVVPIAQAQYAVQGEAGNQTFQNNKAFYWSEPLTPAVAELVLRAAKDIDLNDDAGVAARIQMTRLMADLSTATDALTAAVTDDAAKTALANLRDLVDEKVTSLTEDEIDENIKKTESDLAGANGKIALVAKNLSGALRETIALIGKLGVDRAKLGQTDASRDAMQKQIDDLNKTLPTDLPAEVVAAKTAREALLVTYEGHFRDKTRRAELTKLISDAAKAVPALTADVQAKKQAVDSLYDQKEAQFQLQYRIGKRGEIMINSVISNTSYFENLFERVTFNFNPSGVKITIVGFPEKDRTLSTDDKEQSIANVSYAERGGVLRFEVSPVKGGHYMRFRISRTRPEITDGRLFYQGEMDLCKFGTNCDVKAGNLLRHGIAKFATSN